MANTVYPLVDGALSPGPKRYNIPTPDTGTMASFTVTGDLYVAADATLIPEHMVDLGVRVVGASGASGYVGRRARLSFAQLQATQPLTADGAPHPYTYTFTVNDATNPAGYLFYVGHGLPPMALVVRASVTVTTA